MSRAARWHPVAWACLIAALAMPVEAAPWLQYAGSSDGSSSTQDPGPATDDIAWRSNLGGSRAMFGYPLIIGGSAYVLESSGPVSRDGSTDRLHRIDLQTGDTTVVADLDQMASNLASDGTRLVVAGSDSILVLSLEDASVLRTLPYPADLVPNPYRTLCLLMTVDRPRLYTFCIALGNEVEASTAAYEGFQRPFRDLLRVADGATAAVAFVAAYDLENGTAEWVWFPEASSHTGTPSPAGGVLAQGLALASMLPMTIPTGLAVLGDHVVATGGYWEGMRDWTTRSHPEGHCFLVMLDPEDGTIVRRFTSLDDGYDAGPRQTPLSCVFAGEPRGDETRIFGKFERVFTINPETYGYLRTQELEGGQYETGSGAAFDGTSAYIGSWKRVYKFSPELVPEASFSIDPAVHDALLDGSPILTPSTLYVMTHDDRDETWHARGALYALRSDDMALRWRMELPHAADSVYGLNYVHAVGEGLLVMAGMDGNVMAIGRTDASPVPVVRASTLYPGVGEEIELDLSASRAGSRGPPPDAYRVEWGDGAVTDWQPDPILRHAYAAAPSQGEAYAVRVQARNAAGQSASEFVEVYAGGSAPLPQPSMPSGSILSILAPLLLLPVAAFVVLARKRRAAAVPAKRFEVLRELGRGASGVTHLARDIQLDRLAALKQPYATMRMGARERDRFLREAKLLGRVQHPNVVTVYGVLPEEDPPAIVLEYAPGGSLEDLLAASGALEPERAHRLTIEILQGLAAVHAAGILHRDLKPSNVMLDGEGRAKVSDFGIARDDVEPSANETMAFGGTVMGTIAYMSPERLEGEPATQRSDLYAAAAISYRMFTGRHHADGPDWSAEAVRRRILATTPDTEDAAIPASLRPALRRALEREPGRRQPDVRTFLAEVSGAPLEHGGGA